ncbi:OB-fold putative lipoprotein [Blautia sp. MSJ-19]|uniref:OB-fold putative lipoprotein n=1 Tax=Blautia sp. MSJ-19 TaxID=2841517 RepID=UPI001C0EAFDF|nr:OB-fold putative lipoprotein [Blautia sp. MSJ-19]MBU5481744.1 OB-fold putative lipoprotein [Blautia sp. MSJ-19]
MEKTKKCKYCKTEIPADAKVCPQCRKKLKGGKLKWIVIAIIVIAILGAALGGESSSSTSTPSKTSTASEESTPIEYTAVSVNDMMSDLDSNAMGASDKYKGQYLEITGKLTNIDASGKYIDLMADGDFEIIGVQCYIKNDDQKAKVASLTKGDTVTLKGKCTDVGEVLGYSLDIDEIE